MNVETGEIREFDSIDKFQEAMATGNWIELEKRPNSKCKKCYGHGHVGYDLVHGQYITCDCVKRVH